MADTLIAKLCCHALFHFMHLLINNWAYIAQRCMSTFAIIEHLDVIENIFFALFKSFIYFVFNPFSFQTAKETFHTSIIPAVTFSAHMNNLVP